MKKLALSTALMLALCASPLMAQDEIVADPPMAQPLPYPDKDYSDLTASEFATRMAVANRTHRQLALIARGRALSPEAREYAEKVLLDQAAADQQLADFAKANRLSLPVALDSDNQAVIDRLMPMLGAEFDREYMKFNLQAYSDQVELLHAAAAMPDQRVAEFANAQLPVALAHRVAATSSTLTAQQPNDE